MNESLSNHPKVQLQTSGNAIVGKDQRLD